MLTQFYLQNLHFALNIFVAMVMSWCFWLYLDVWMIRKTLRESLKFLGFLFLTFSFLLHAFSLETSILNNALLPENLYNYSLLVSKILGYLLISIGIFLEPNLPNPLKKKLDPRFKMNNRSDDRQDSKAIMAISLMGVTIPLTVIGNLSLPILASLTGLLFLYKSTLGLEFHLRRVSIAFFGMSLFELLAERSLFINSANVAVFKLMSPFSAIWWVEHSILFISSLILAKWIFGYLLRRLQTQLYIFFSISILLIFIISTLSFTGLLLTNIQNEALNQIEVNAKVLDYTLESKKDELLSDMVVVSNDSKIAESIIGDQKSQLAKLTSDYLVAKKLNFLVITNPTGQVIARGEENERIGDSMSSNSIIKRTLSGKLSSSVIARDGVLAPDILVSSAVPINNKDNLIGVVYGGILLNNSFLDGINKATGLATSIYGGNKISATTLLAENSAVRRIGLTETNKVITTKVLGEGASFIGANNFLNTPYFSAYLPLKDIDNVPVGMLFVGKPQITVLATAGRSIQASFVVAGILWLLAILPSYLIAGYVTKQLK